MPANPAHSVWQWSAQACREKLCGLTKAPKRSSERGSFLTPYKAGAPPALSTMCRKPLVSFDIESNEAPKKGCILLLPDTPNAGMFKAHPHRCVREPKWPVCCHSDQEEHGLP